MLLFSLGPVQSFIVQARKTRDLWLGSYLLAKLMEAAMKEIDKPEVNFVFPTYRKVDGRNANLPNKYIAIFNSLKEAQDAVEISKDQIKQLWDIIRGEVWEKIIQKYATPETFGIWERQSAPDAFFEFFWVIIEGDK